MAMPNAPFSDRARNVGNAAQQGAAAANNTSRDVVESGWFHLLARIGFAARGLVYLIIGGLAARAALGMGGGATTGKQGALDTLYNQPWGAFILGVVGVGMAALALLYLAFAWFSASARRGGVKGWVKRAAFIGLFVSYGGLAVAAWRLISSGGQNSGSSSNGQAHDWTARLLSAPGGQALVVFVGLIVLGIAAAMYFRAYAIDFRKHLDLSGVASGMRDAIILLGRLGYAALGVVFTIIGAFFVIAAVDQNPGQVRGLSGALSLLLHHAWGDWLLGIVAIGLIAYGVYSFAEARYRRLDQV